MHIFLAKITFHCNKFVLESIVNWKLSLSLCRLIPRTMCLSLGFPESDMSTLAGFVIGKMPLDLVSKASCRRELVYLVNLSSRPLLSSKNSRPKEEILRHNGLGTSEVFAVVNINVALLCMPVLAGIHIPQLARFLRVPHP